MILTAWTSCLPEEKRALDLFSLHAWGIKSASSAFTQFMIIASRRFLHALKNAFLTEPQKHTLVC